MGMRSKYLIFFFLIVALATSSLAIAFGSINADNGIVHVNVRNDEGSARDIRTDVLVIDTGAYRTSTERIRSGRVEGYLYEFDLPKGEYVVMIRSSDKDGHRTRYRHMIVD